MKIGELAAHADLAPSAIRYYESVGLLPPAERISGQRRYSSAALDRVLLIRFAGEMDFTLAEIKLFLNGFRENIPVSSRWRKLTRRKIAELQRRLVFTRLLLDYLKRLQHCRCVQLHQCVAALSLSPRLRALRISRSKAPKPRHAPPFKLASPTCEGVGAALGRPVAPVFAGSNRVAGSKRPAFPSKQTTYE